MLLRRAVLLAVAWSAGVCFGGLAFADDPAAGKQVAQSLEVKAAGDDAEAKTTLHYWLFLPSEYGAKAEQKWPLMLFLHGAGERGDDLSVVKKHGPPKNVETKSDFPFVVISPQCPSGKRWQPSELIQILDHAEKTLAIDKQREYCTGLSMGGFGTWALTAAYPDRFAAAVPICGGGNVADAEKLKSLPLWVFHGAKDTAVKIEKSQEMVDAIKKAGGDPKFTIYPEAGHDSWTESYNNPALYEWLLKQAKTK